jgi:hypothetical protein
METYEQKLQAVIGWRNQIKQAVPDIKYKRVYTRKNRFGECETKFWGISRASKEKVTDFLICNKDFNPGRRIQLGGFKRIKVTKAGTRYLGKLSVTIATSSF